MQRRCFSVVLLRLTLVLSGLQSQPPARCIELELGIHGAEGAAVALQLR